MLPLLKRLRLPRRALVAKVARRGGLAVAASYVAYLSAINLALAQKRLVGLPEEVQVTFGSAWSWLPGRLEARGVRIVGTDSHVQWQLDIDRVRFRVHVTDLAHRLFHASDARASGVSFRMRRTLTAEELTASTLASLPPIEGHPEPPRKPAVPVPPISDADYALWSVQLDDVDAEAAREVWFDAYRFTGAAHVVGAFALRPMRRVWVGPATVEVTQGELRLGAETALEGLAGRLEATIAPFDPREIEGASFLRYVTASARGDGRVTGLGVLSRYLPQERSGVAVGGGAGAVQVDLRVAAGVLAAPSTLTLESESAMLSHGELRAVASARTSLVVNGDEQPPQARLAVALTGLEVWQTGARAPLLRAARLVALGHSVALDLVRPFADATGRVELAELELPDLRLLDRYLGAGVSARAGRAQLRGELGASLPEQVATGQFTLATEGLALRLGETDVRLALHAAVLLHRLDLRSGRGEVSGSHAEATEVVLSSAPKEPPWWAHVQLAGSHVVLGAATRLQTRFTVQAKDGRPLLREAMPFWLAHAVALDGLTGGGVAALGPSQVKLTELHATGDGAELRGAYEKRGRGSHGVALLRCAGLSVGVQLDDGAASLKLLGAEAWFARAVAPGG